MPSSKKVLDTIDAFHFKSVEPDANGSAFRVRGTVGLPGERRFRLELFVVTFKGAFRLYPPVG